MVVSDINLGLSRPAYTAATGQLWSSLECTMTTVRGGPLMAEGSRSRAQDAADEALRRTTEDTRARAEAAQTALNEVSAASRKVFDAWASGAEATLKATFEAENAALQAGISMLEATAAADRTALEQWGEVARQAQKAALDAFRANLRAARQITDTSSR
jgi:hypothetical protein